MAVLHRRGGSAGLTEIEQAARGVCRPVMFFDRSVAEDDPGLVRRAEELFPVRVFAPPTLAESVRDAEVEGVTTFHDREVENVTAVASALGLPGVPAGPNPWDKLTQRTLLAEAGLTHVTAVAVDSAHTFAEALDKVRLPAILKPRRGVGGTGIAFVDNTSDADHQLRHRTQWPGLLLESRLPPHEHPRNEWLADYVSVETASTQDAHVPIAIFDKAPVSVYRRAGPDASDVVSVTGDLTPTMLPLAVRNRVLDYVREVLAALRVRWCVTHTEVKLLPDAVDLIEVNGRVGGHLPRLLRALEGPNLLTIAMSLALAQEPNVPPLADGAPRGYAMGLFPAFGQRAGTVHSAVTRDQLERFPCIVRVDEVAERGRLRRATGYRAANVVLRARDEGELTAAVTAVTAGISALFNADGLGEDPWFENFHPPAGPLR
ncbi:ATP-grasp domain-containing protein [Streptomyces marianii]|uniref:ATP-grasp domain-containing protein n=1 Tax=Streptomyces marianii TaxID=1817406 RepID=A0A5R9E8S4_9ACTN|nr:ATP-grasp domain-containing protein [Streptomyces marianii]TLQ45279.1 ATP-grasp domain-containing protein [Streptomyces marianii]